MLRAWRAWQTAAAPDNPTAWMTTIARREAARWMAGPNGRSWASATAEPPASPQAADDALVALDVQRAVEQLPAGDRALVALRYRADLTQREIARVTGIPEGSVKVRLHRARAKLRAHLS